MIRASKPNTVSVSSACVIRCKRCHQQLSFVSFADPSFVICWQESLEWLRASTPVFESDWARARHNLCEEEAHRDRDLIISFLTIAITHGSVSRCCWNLWEGLVWVEGCCRERCKLSLNDSHFHCDRPRPCLCSNFFALVSHGLCEGCSNERFISRLCVNRRDRQVIHSLFSSVSYWIELTIWRSSGRSERWWSTRLAWLVHSFFKVLTFWRVDILIFSLFSYRAGDLEGMISIFRTKDWECIKTLRGHKCSVKLFSSLPYHQTRCKFSRDPPIG